MNSKRTRKVKIYSKFRGGGWRLCDPAPKEVPWLNVSGNWLKEAGFAIGDRIEIIVNQKELLIKNCGTDGDH
jgi:hypothetical protein